MKKLIAKGALLYTTSFIVLLFIAGVDSIMDKGFHCFFAWILVCAILVFSCYKLISEDELKKLTFNNLEDE